MPKDILSLEQRMQMLFYKEGDLWVQTEKSHLLRQSCCGNGCRHCAFWPKYQKGNTSIKPSLLLYINSES
jgi:hypothetical protein